MSAQKKRKRKKKGFHMSLIEHTNNTYRTWLTNAGDFGINRSVPAAKLHVQNSGNIFRCGDGTAVFNIYCDTADVFGRQFLMGTTTADGLTFITNHNVRGSIQSNGYWAIGSGSDALYPLHVLYNRATGAGTLTYRWYRSDGNNQNCFLPHRSVIPLLFRIKRIKS